MPTLVPVSPEELRVIKGLTPVSASEVPPAKKPLWQNAVGEAWGGLMDMARMVGGPGATRLYTEKALNAPTVAGVPTQGDPEFHNSYAGRAIRFAVPSALPLGGKGPLGLALSSAVGGGIGAASGLASKAAEDANLSAPAQMAVTMLPSLLASGGVAATKGLIRGGPSKGREIAANMDALEAKGVTDYALSQVAPEGNLRIPYFEQGAGFAFGGKTVFEKTARAQADQMQSHLAKVAGGTVNQADEAGKAAWKGLFGEKGWVSRAKENEKVLWGPVDAALEKAKVDVVTPPTYGNFTPEMAANLGRGKKPTVSQELGVRPTNYEKALKEIVGSFDSPNQSAAYSGDKVAAAERLAALQKDGGRMTFNDFKEARRIIGEANSGSRLIPAEKGLSVQQAGKLWGALMDDYRALAAKEGIANEFAAAHSYSKNYHETSRNFFKTIFGKEHEPAKIIEEIASGNFQQPGKWRALKESLDPKDYNELQQYVVNRLGVPPGSSAADWSLMTLHTNYKNAFGSSAKSGNAVADEVLGPKGDAVRDGMEAMFKVAEKTKQGAAIMFNSSGTAGSGIAGSSIQAILTGIAKAGPQLLAGGVGAAAGGGLGLAAGIATGAGMVNGAARLMTSPRFGRWLSKTAMQSTARLPAAVVALSQTPLETQEMEEAKAAFLEEYNRQFGQQTPAP